MLSIYELAERLSHTFNLNYKVWEAGDIKRIYINDVGYNTRKMATKTFIWQDEYGEFKVSCHIDCSSQPWNWIRSQQKEVIDNVMERIRKVLVDTHYIAIRKEDGKVFYNGDMKDKEEFMHYNHDTYLSEDEIIECLKSEGENIEDYDIMAISHEDANVEYEKVWEKVRNAQQHQECIQ